MAITPDPHQDIRQQLLSGNAPIDWLTINQIHNITGIPKVTLRRHVDKGALPAVRTRGGAIRILRVELVRYLGVDQPSAATQ